MPIKRENIDAPMSRFVTPEGTLPLHHYTSHVNGDVDSFETEPSRFGKNPWSQAEVKAERTPKTFFYVDPGDREDNWFGDETPHFTAAIDPAKVYDASVDRHRIVSRLRNISRVIHVLKRLGYHGMYYSGSFPTVAMWKPVPMRRVVKLARMKAPAGGAVANNQFHKGGQFLPRAFRRIRDVVAKAAEWESRRLRLARRKEPVPFTGIDATIAAEGPRYAKDKHPLPGVVASTLPEAFTREQPTLTLGQLRHIEDEHGIAQRHRLSPKVTVTNGGEGIVAGSDDVAAFLDHLTQKRLQGHHLGKLLKDGTIRDNEKMVYMLNHMVHDANWYGSESDWYGKSMDTFDKGLHHLLTGGRLGKHPLWGDGKPSKTAPWEDAPGLVLAKALLAITSGNQKPVPNTKAMLTALKAGIDRAGPNSTNPFEHIPATNEPALHAWLEKAQGVHGDTISPLALRAIGPNRKDAYGYWKQVIAPHEAVLGGRSPGFKALQLMVTHDGRHVATENNDRWDYEPDAPAIFAEQGKKGIRKVWAPLPDENGMIQPKGWTNRGEQVAHALGNMKLLIRDKGVKGAAHWLLTTHPDKEFADLFGRVPERGYLPRNEALPGSFIFGEKFGPFLLNLHGNDRSRAAEYGKYLTTDLWWTRTWNRYLGSLFKAVNGGHEQVRAPTKPKERRFMWEVAKGAATRLGLKSVAELQATLWYYEQNLWRWFGSKTPSQSYADGINEALKEHGHDPVK